MGKAFKIKSVRSCLAVLAVVLSVCALYLTGRQVTPTTATMADVRQEAAAGGYGLMNTEELAQLYQRGVQGFMLIDTRQGWEYRAGHIKGALNFPLEPTWWSRWRSKDALAGFLGPDKNRLLVFY